MSIAGQIAKRLEKVRRDLLTYKERWPRIMGKIALDWVNESFELQGYRDQILIPWQGRKNKKRQGRLLRASGKLQKSIRVRALNASFRLYTYSRYAKAHNDGFKGTVQVRAHQRRKKLIGVIQGLDDKAYSYGSNMSIKSRRSLKEKPVHDVQQVKTHSRKMNIPRRQFMPSAKRGSALLLKEIKTNTQKDIKKILKIAR